jgi:hypothetical protein
MYPNGNSGIGSKMLSQIIDNATINNATTGRYFLVAKAALTNISEIKSIVGATYPDGTPVVYTTIALANAKCVAGRGDVILVAPGHTETISSATAITMSISGVQVVGLGTGSQRPVVTLDTANTATINVTANGVSFKNIIFVANFLAIASAFTLTTATDFQLLGCEFRDTSAVLDFLFIVTTDATSNHADGLVIDSCYVTSTTAAGVQGLVSFLGTNDRCRITNNVYMSLSTNTAAIIPIATGKILTTFVLSKNRMILTSTTGATTGIVITTNGSTNTGVISDNYVAALDDTSPLFCTATNGFYFFNNLYVATQNASGFLLPAIGS